MPGILQVVNKCELLPLPLLSFQKPIAYLFYEEEAMGTLENGGGIDQVLAELNGPNCQLPSSLLIPGKWPAPQSLLLN